MNKFKIIIPLLLIISSCIRDKKLAYQYLPDLKKVPVKIVHEEKIQIDASYVYPYTLYLELSVDSFKRIELISLLHLRTKYDIDTINLKKNTNIDEFQNYFEMRSINLDRVPSLKTIEEKIKWWPKQNFTEPIYSTSYFDYQRLKKVVPHNQRKNGRIAVSFDKTKAYILLECWG